MENAYEEELIDPFTISFDDIKETIEAGKESSMKDLTESKEDLYRLIDNTIEELENWVTEKGTTSSLSQGN